MIESAIACANARPVRGPSTRWTSCQFTSSWVYTSRTPTIVHTSPNPAFRPIFFKCNIFTSGTQHNGWSSEDLLGQALLVL
jgi:hypothetical protein